MKLVEEAHLETLHGGVVLTMSRIRDNYYSNKVGEEIMFQMLEVNSETLSSPKTSTIIENTN